MKQSRSSQFVLAAVCILGCSGVVHLQTRKSHGGEANSPGSMPVAAPPVVVKAHSGDSITSVAKRAQVAASELALVNQLSLRSRLTKGQRLLLPAPTKSDSGEIATDGPVTGKRITFTDGGTLVVDEAWTSGGNVWYTRGGVTESPGRTVRSIEPLHARTAKSSPVPDVTLPGSGGTDAAGANLATWIYLVDGARFKVDSVRELPEGTWYTRGNLSNFVESNRIARVERDSPTGTDSGWKERGWTSGNAMIDQLIKTNGNRFQIDPYLVFLVIEQESHFRAGVVSPKGARGLMQLMPGTARRFGVRRAFDPAENVRAGTQYLRELIDMFGGRVDLALASYNAGEGRVISYGNRVPPFRETQEYVKRISKRYGKDASSKDPRRLPTGGRSQLGAGGGMP